nr:hypothetical protein [Candidatus Nanopelagicales bacterium]
MSGIDRPTPRMQVVDHGVEQGISWVTCRAPLYGAVNGYVKIPEGHHWHGLDYDSFGVDVHGGLTYGGGPSGWVGFDCLHSGDVWPEGPSWDRGKPWSKNWTAELVAEETRRLARNIAAGHVEPTQLDWLAQAAAELSGAAAHVADDEWPVGEVQGTPPRPPVAPPGEQLPPHADLPTLRAGVRDRHHSRAVWGVPE